MSTQPPAPSLARLRELFGDQLAVLEEELALPSPIPPWRKADLVYQSEHLERVEGLTWPEGFRLEAATFRGEQLVDRLYPWQLAADGGTLRLRFANESNGPLELVVTLRIARIT